VIPGAVPLDLDGQVNVNVPDVRQATGAGVQAEQVKRCGRQRGLVKVNLERNRVVLRTAHAATANTTGTVGTRL